MIWLVPASPAWAGGVEAFEDLLATLEARPETPHPALIDAEAP